MKASEQQIGGNHYKDMPIQPVHFCERNGLTYAQGAVIKYVCRFKDKGGKEDLLKARHFIDLLIEEYYPFAQDADIEFCACGSELHGITEQQMGVCEDCHRESTGNKFTDLLGSVGGDEVE